MSAQSLLFLALVFVLCAGIAAAAAWFLTPDRFRRRIHRSQPRGSQGPA